MKIGFIGLGNMASAMIGGMLDTGTFSPDEIIGSAKTQATADRAAQRFGIAAGTDNQETARQADVLILAVKPQMLGEVIAQIKNQVKEETLVISIAAGKDMAWMEEAFGRKIKLVRCMPNTPAMVGEGCSGVCRNAEINDQEMDLCMNLLGSFGMAEEIPEGLMDAVGGVSGSSPAFVFLFLEALADGGVKAGLPRGQAYRFAAQTVLGSAKLMLEGGKHPGELKDMVCSPGGTTIEGVQVLEQMGFRASVMGAVEACVAGKK